MTTRLFCRLGFALLMLWGGARARARRCSPSMSRPCGTAAPVADGQHGAGQPGYIWVGTWGGLARYNGGRFHNYTTDDGLAQRPDPGTARGQPRHTLGGHRRRHRGHARRTTHAHRQFKPEKTALPRPAGGPRRRHLDRHRPGRLPRAQGYIPGRTGADGLERQIIYDLASDRGAILIAGDQGLWRYEPGGGYQQMDIPCPRNQIRTIAVTGDGIWLGTSTSGAFLKDAAGWHSMLASGQVTGRTIYRIYAAPSGTLYICTSDSALFLRRVGEKAFQHWNTDMGLPSNVVNFTFEDREGNVWVGTDINGLARLGGVALSNHGLKQGLPSDCVFGIASSPTAGALWLGTLNGAVHYQVRPNSKVLETIGLADGLDTEWVWKVLPEADGGLWILTDTSLFHRPRGQRRLQLMPPSVPVPRAELWDATFDHQNRLWVCGRGETGGLVMRDVNGAWRAWTATAAGEPLTFCAHFVPAGPGGVWATVETDVFFCDGERVVKLAERPLSRQSYINSIFEDSVGRLWVGSDAGLAVMDGNGRWRLLNDQPGLTSHHVYFFGEDRRHNIWVGTTRGCRASAPTAAWRASLPRTASAGYETNQYGFHCDAGGEI